LASGPPYGDQRVTISYTSPAWLKPLVMPLFADMTLTLHKSQIHCSVVKQWWACSSQFTHVRSISCRGRLRNVRADCSIVVPYCVPITWQQIYFKLRY